MFKDKYNLKDYRVVTNTNSRGGMIGGYHDYKEFEKKYRQYYNSVIQHSCDHITNPLVEDFIAHHGVKGQSWGVRKYQYEDGSLTPEGKKRYGVGDGTNKKDPPTKDKKQVSKSKPQDKSVDTGEKTQEELQAEAARKAARRKKIAIAAGVTATAIIGALLAKKYHDMKIQNGELQEEAAKGEERFNALKNENDFLQTNSKSMAGTIDKLTKEKTGMKKELFEARKTNASLETQARGMSKTITDLRAQSGNLKKDFYKEKKAIEAGHARTVSLLESNLKVANIQAEAGNQLANVSQVHQRTYRKILEGISNGKVLFGYKGSK